MRAVARNSGGRCWVDIVVGVVSGDVAGIWGGYLLHHPCPLSFVLCCLHLLLFVGPSTFVVMHRCAILELFGQSVVMRQVYGWWVAYIAHNRVQNLQNNKRIVLVVCRSVGREEGEGRWFSWLGGSVSWQNESVHTSIKASITQSGNCQTVIDTMSMLKSKPEASSLLAMPKRL
jgi:hypothetical protein